MTKWRSPFLAYAHFETCQVSKLPLETSYGAHTLRTWSTHEFHRFRKFQDDPTSITIKIHGFSILGSSKILKKAPNIHERVL